MQEQLHEARRVFQQAIGLGTPPEGHLFATVGVASAYQVNVWREWNQLDSALDLALQGIRCMKQTNYTLSIDTGYIKV
jgi:tetratricopeptide repeat protein